MKIKKIFILGIGGKGLNGIAQICLEKGIEVCGVDKNKTLETENLKKRGAKIYYEHRAQNIDNSFDLVIYSSIISQKCLEILEAQKLNIKILKRSQFLKLLIKNTFKISIAGSHGKSTTTAITGLALTYAGQNPDIYCGAFVKELGSYNRNGAGKISVVEACEYDRSFYDLIGDATIITSLEKSHLEYYKNESEMISAFRYFVQKHSDYAPIIVNGDDVNIRRAIVPFQNSKKIISYGFNSSNDYLIKNITLSNTKTVFSIFRGGRLIVKDLEIKIPGFYNVLNFAALIVLFKEFNFNFIGIDKVAQNFTGIGRRFEVRESPDGKIFVDDFAHHPTQVRNLFYGLKQFYPKHKICAIFQPRQYNLIRNFLKEYGASFKLADNVILTEIVPALGDTSVDLNSLGADDVAKSIECYSGKRPIIQKKFENIVNYLKKNLKENTIIATIGAGDIYKIRDLYFKNFRFN
jgi:UDP-N-acetylmuramate--alanine ligase